MSSRKRIASVFRRAQVLIWDGKHIDDCRWPTSTTGKSEFICHAIARISKGPAGKAAKKIVMRRISPCNTLESWLVQEAKVSKGYGLNKVDVQAHRLAWLKVLEKEYSENVPSGSGKGIAEAFTYAKKYLWNGKRCPIRPTKERHICLALELAYDNSDISREQFSAAKSVIENRIAPALTIEEWLKINGHASITDRDSERVQKFRKAWLDSLIAEYQSM